MPPRRAITGRSQEPRQRFADELRLLRAKKGDTLRQLGDALGWDWSLFGKMESGQTIGSPEVAQALDHYYGLPDLLLILWELAAADLTQFRERYRRYMTLEAEATAIQWHSPCLVPGLLQTKAYAHRVLFLGGVPVGSELNQQVEARMTRREVLNGDTYPQFRAILDEAVLRRSLPRSTDWHEQLKHLVDAAERPNVTLQVVPFAAGLCEMSGTDTVFLRLPGGRTVAWVETEYSGELVQECTAVERLQVSYDRLRDHALSPRESAEFITQILEATPCPPPGSE